jgi:hypothetical protein
LFNIHRKLPLKVPFLFNKIRSLLIEKKFYMYITDN